MILPHNALVAVADGQTMSLFRNAGREGEVLLESVVAPTLHPSPAGSGGRHNSSSANHDRSRLSEDAFAAAAAHWLNQEIAAGRISDLVVIAPPKTLGELRLHYTPALRAKIIGEAAKELAGHSRAEVEAAVGHIQ